VQLQRQLPLLLQHAILLVPPLRSNRTPSVKQRPHNLVSAILYTVRASGRPPWAALSGWPVQSRGLWITRAGPALLAVGYRHRV
jgi:hypothetical protein